MTRTPVPVAATASTLEAMRGALHASQRDDPLLPPMAALLASLADARVSGARQQAWVDLLDWTRHGVLVFRSEDAGAQLGSGDTVRLRLLLHVLETCAPVRAGVQGAVAKLLTDTDAASLLAEAGMPSSRGFLGEATSRLWAKVLPEPRDSRDLSQFVRRGFRHAADVARFRRWPADLFHRLVEAVVPAPESAAWNSLRRSVIDAVHLLCVRVEAQALAPNLRERSRTARLPVMASPFFRLARAADGLLARWEPGAAAPAAGAPTVDAIQAWHDALDACRTELGELTLAIRGDGVSVDIGFSLDVLDRCLTRLELLGTIIEGQPGQARSLLVQRLVTELIGDLHEARSLRSLLSGNLRQLHRRIVERSARTSEHFIAQGWREYAHLLLAAAGGGVLMVATTAVKFVAAEHHSSPFIDGAIYGIIYAVSFLLLHHLHLVLATKHPAMTATKIATILRDGRGDGRIEEIVDEMARVSHSQIAAAFGNVLMVALGAMAFTACWELAWGSAFLDHGTAERTYDSFSPLTSGTVFFAALTGVLLWLSAVAGGWLDNWSSWRRIPQGIADHPLGDRLGRERLSRWSRSWQRHIGAWGSNISLGLMLGMVPSLGLFFGLPLEMRHVTLSTGMLFTACGSLGDGWYSSAWFLLAASGIVTMFVLNLGVSFTLSLWTALRALEVPSADIAALRRRLAARVMARPLDFLLPTRRPLPAAPEPAPAPVTLPPPPVESLSKGP